MSDERVLHDILRSLKARESSDILTDNEVRSLAVQGVEQYWLERDALAGQRVRKPIPLLEQLEMGDDIALSFQLANQKLADLQERFITEKVLLVLPCILVGLVLLLFPSFPNTNARLFQNDKLAQLIGLSTVLLGSILGIVAQWKREHWMYEWRRGLRYFMGLFAGALFATSMVIIVGLQREHTSKALQLTAAALQQSMGESEILDVARNKIEEGKFENSSGETQILTLNNQKTVKMIPREINRDRLVYRAEGEGLPSPIEIQIDKTSGELSLLKEGGDKEKTAEFFVGEVDEITKDKLTLKITDEKGNKRSLSFALNSLMSYPSKGQRVFVAVDPASNTATEIEKVTADAPKSSSDDAKKGGEH